MVVVASCYGMRIGNPTLTFNATVSMTLSDFYNLDFQVSGLFVPALSFPGAKSPHRELSLLWNFRSLEPSLPYLNNLVEIGTAICPWTYFGKRSLLFT